MVQLLIPWLNEGEQGTALFLQVDWCVADIWRDSLHMRGYEGHIISLTQFHNNLESLPWISAFASIAFMELYNWHAALSERSKHDKHECSSLWWNCSPSGMGQFYQIVGRQIAFRFWIIQVISSTGRKFKQSICLRQSKDQNNSGNLLGAIWQMLIEKYHKHCFPVLWMNLLQCSQLHSDWRCLISQQPECLYHLGPLAFPKWCRKRCSNVSIPTSYPTAQS